MHPWALLLAGLATLAIGMSHAEAAPAKKKPLPAARKAARCTQDGLLCRGDPAFARDQSWSLSFGKVAAIEPDGRIRLQLPESEGGRILTVPRSSAGTTRPPGCPSADGTLTCPGQGIVSRAYGKGVVLAVFPDGGLAISRAGGETLHIPADSPKGPRDLDGDDAEELKALLTQYGYVSKLVKMEWFCAACQIDRSKYGEKSEELKLALRLLERHPLLPFLLDGQDADLEAILDSAIEAREKALAAKPKGKVAPGALQRSRLAHGELARALAAALGAQPAPKAGTDLARCLATGQSSASLDACLDPFLRSVTLASLQRELDAAAESASIPESLRAPARKAHAACLSGPAPATPELAQRCLKLGRAKLREARVSDLTRSVQAELVAEAVVKKRYPSNPKDGAARVAKLTAESLAACIRQSVHEDLSSADIDECRKSARKTVRSTLALEAATARLKKAVALSPAAVERTFTRSYAPCLQDLLDADDDADNATFDDSACLEAAILAARVDALTQATEAELLREPIVTETFGADAAAAEKELRALLGESLADCFIEALKTTSPADATAESGDSCRREARLSLRSELYTRRALATLRADRKADQSRIRFVIPRKYTPCINELLKADQPRIDDKACLQAALTASADPLEPDSLTRTSSFARTLLDHPDWYQSEDTTKLSSSCASFLKGLYAAGKTLYSDELVKASRPISEFPLKSGGRVTDFFHYTDAKAMLDQFHGELSDRKEAHERSLKEGTYDKAFQWFRQRKSDLYNRVLYVAEDPSSSRGYGSRRITFELSPDAKVVRMTTNTLPGSPVPIRQRRLTRKAGGPELIQAEIVLAELFEEHPGLEKACTGISRKPLQYFALEDSGIDLVDHGVGGHPLQWFQLIRPNAIQRVDLRY